MFVAERLVYLQLQKTGSTQIAELLARCVPGKQIGKHNRPREPPPGKRIVGSIRSPWDWYVSLWAIGCQGRGSVWERLTQRPRPAASAIGGVLCSADGRSLLVGSFAPAKPRSAPRDYALWAACYADSERPELFRRWLRLVLDPSRRAEVDRGYGSSPVGEMAGLLSYRCVWLYSRDLQPLFAGPFRDMADLRRFDRRQNVLDAVIRLESLEDDVLRVLEEAGYALNDDQAATIRARCAVKRNASNRREAAWYYDHSTVELVAEKEALIIGKYGYHPPEPAAH